MQQTSVWQYIKNGYKTAGIVGRLIAINLAVFIFETAFWIRDSLYKIERAPNDSGILEWLGASGDMTTVASRPWTIFTQLFTHASFGHFVFNMIALFFIGRLFLHYLGAKRLLSTYLIGGIFAYLVHIAAFYTFPIYSDSEGTLLLGASGSIMAMFAAIAFYKPDLKMRLIFLPKVEFSLFIFFAIYVLIDLMGLASSERSSTAHFAHLGGAIFGAVSIIKVSSPKHFMSRLERFFSKLKLKGMFKRKPKLKVLTPDKVKRMDDDQYRGTKAENQEAVDAILDKINKKGYESLTKEEKQILFNASKRD
jgi:membrane associated rhomboid family serine protease